MSWKQKIHQFLKSLREVSIFYFIWVLLKFIFYFEGVSKNCESVKKAKEN